MLLIQNALKKQEIYY